MDGPMQEVARTLQFTFDIDANVRASAEKRIKEFESQPGLAVILLQLACNDAVSPDIRVSAAVTFKNLVRKNWGPVPDIDLSDEEEERVRGSVLEAMYNNQGKLQFQLIDAVHIISKRDFPEKWPNLIESLGEHLTTVNMERLAATLSTMDELFKKFRTQGKSTELWRELKHCLEICQERLTKVFVEMSAQTPNIAQMTADTATQWMEVSNLCASVFHSLCYQTIPEYFEDHLREWVDSFLIMLTVDCPTFGAGNDATPQDKMKAEICDILTLYAQSYEDETKDFMERIIQAIWNLIEGSSNGVRYDNMICSGLTFLALICQKSQYVGYFESEAALRAIAENVCIRNMSLRGEDLELFEDEPLDYMKRDLEGTDVGTRRRGAVDLVRALFRRYESLLVSILGNLVPHLMSTGDWKHMDVVYCLVSAMSSKTGGAERNLVNTSDFYMNQVRNHLLDKEGKYPILIADALKYVSAYRAQFSVDILVDALKLVNEILSVHDNILILHKYAAYTIEKLLLVKLPTGNGADVALVFTAANTPVATLLTSLVGAFEKDPKSQNSPYLIKAILRVVSLIDDSTAAIAGDVATRLVSLVERATKNPADSVHTHFLFETMCVLIKKTAHLPNGSLDASLLPLIETILTQDLVDLIPYALQITGVLLAASVARGQPLEQYFGFLPSLLSPSIWSRSSNVPAAITVLEVFLKHSPQNVLSSHGPTIMQHYVHFIASKSNDQHGFQIAHALLPCFEFLPADSMSVVFNNMFKRVQAGKTPKFMKQFVAFIGRFVIVRGVSTLVQTLDSIQNGLFVMVIEKVVMPELESLQRTSTNDKCIIIIGFASILSDPSTLQLLRPFFGNFVTGLVQIMQSVSTTDKDVRSPEEEQEAFYSAENEFVNPYCRLSHAPRPDSIIPAGTDYKRVLADVILRRVPEIDASLTHCVPAEINQVLTAIANQS